MSELKQLAQEIADVLTNKQLTVATAESCTGGGLSYFLTSISGSSQWFDRGFVSYSNAAKVTMLGVKEKTLKDFGAVSAEIALEMAQGALSHSDAQIAIAITGIAGPDGGTETKPVGTVWIAWVSTQFFPVINSYLFSGDRDNVRTQTILTSLTKLKELLA